MQFVPITGALCSGKLGGLVGTRGRAGGQLRARIVPRQVVTPSASEARAITGGLAALWRLLTAAEQQTWTKLANEINTVDALGQGITLSGYALYIACSRRLITVGITQPLHFAPAIPYIPPIEGCQAYPLYNAVGTAAGLTDLMVETSIPLDPNYLPVLRATAALSQAKANIRNSDMRVIAAGQRWASNPVGVLKQWEAIYGTYPDQGTITFELSLTDPGSGISGAPVRATLSYAFAETPSPTPGDVTVQVEGSTVAVIADTWVQVEGQTVAN